MNQEDSQAFRLLGRPHRDYAKRFLLGVPAGRQPELGSGGPPESVPTGIHQANHALAQGSKLDKLVDTMTERCSNLTDRQPEISSRITFA